MPEIPTKPYLVRALFEWCNDCGYTPYVTVAVGENAQVPHEYVKEGEIVLNVSPLATNRLSIGNDYLEFQARFGGVAREVRVPVDYISAIYARETGQGMAFDLNSSTAAAAAAAGGVPLDAADEVPEESASTPVAPSAGSAAPASAGGFAPLRALPSPDPDLPPRNPGPGPAGGERPRLTRIK